MSQAFTQFSRSFMLALGLMLLSFTQGSLAQDDEWIYLDDIEPPIDEPYFDPYLDEYDPYEAEYESAEDDYPPPAYDSGHYHEYSHEYSEPLYERQPSSLADEISESSNEKIGRHKPIFFYLVGPDLEGRYGPKARVGQAPSQN